jgi:hypothetical protein
VQAEPDDTPLVAGGEEPTYSMGGGPGAEYFWTYRISETLGP